MRWTVFFIISISMGLWEFFLGPQLRLAAIHVPVELLFLLAFHTALHCPASYILPAFWWCGLMQDFFLGNRLGTNALLFSFSAFVMGWLRTRFPQNRWPLHLLFIGGMLLPVLALRPVLDLHVFRSALSPPAFQAAAASALLTALCSPLAGLLLQVRSLRTWQEAEDPYGLTKG